MTTELQLHFNDRPPYLRDNWRHSKPQSQPNLTKPTFGMWTSTFIDMDKGSEWSVWCADNQYHSSKQRTWKIQPLPEASVYTVSKQADADHLKARYGIQNHFLYTTLDWDAIAQDYDAVRFTGEEHVDEFYGWDCESTVWFRPVFDWIEDMGEQLFTYMERANKKFNEDWG